MGASKLKVPALKKAGTGRNLNTVVKLAAMTRALAVARAHTIAAGLQPHMTSRRLTLLVLLVAVFFLLPSGVQFYADWLWFGEVGYQGVYARSLTTQSTLWLTTFVVAFGVLTLNLRLAFRVLTRREIVMVTPEGPRAIVVDPARLRPVVTLASAAGARAGGVDCRGAVGDVARLLERGAVRQGGSGARLRRRLLRVPAAVLALAALAGDRCSSRSPPSASAWSTSAPASCA